MSLITDTDYLIHRLRLSYLRDVDDPYGARIITLDPSYSSNPYIIAANLADPDRWPELSMPSSPQLSEDDGERPTGFPGARLRYTHTIMGNKSGGLGLRVHGKRASISKRLSNTPRQEDVKNYIAEAAPVKDVLTDAAPITSSLVKPNADVWITASEHGKAGNGQPQNEEKEEPPPEPPPKAVQFIPKFKGAAEMEARRRARMLARRGPIGNQRPPPSLNPEASSSSDEDIPAADDGVDSDADSDFGVPASNDSMDDGDDFDPDFPPAQTLVATNSDSPTDLASVVSGSLVSTSNSSVPVPSHIVHKHSRSRLDHNAELRVDGNQPNPPKLRTKSSNPYLNMSMPPSKTDPYYSPRKLDSGRVATQSSAPNKSAPTSPPPVHPEISFTRRKVNLITPQKSALTAMLASSTGSSNPFSELYSAISGRGELASTTVQIFFPHAQEPSGNAMELNVRRDATVEEVTGFALWNYWEKGWLPKLDEGLSGEADPNWEIRLSTVGWILRLAEEDGEVDDDFPPPDRSGKIIKFNADAYAVLEASPAQVQQNKQLEAKIQRPTRTPAKKTDKPTQGGLAVPSILGLSTSVSQLSTMGSTPLSTSLGPSSHGPQIFLRIRVAESADAVHISTTINVSAGMYMQEVLELVCRKQRLVNPKDYALLVADKSMIIPLDRTVASLAGARELVLMKRSALPQLGGDLFKAGRTTDPNASIFKRMSEVSEPQFSTSDYTTAYKKYTIYRKMPMIVTRQERILAIDGVYLHIMPSANKAKAVFDSGKTVSYHIKSIADCQQSVKSSSTFKLIVTRSMGKKQYDFEAENPKLANEIVQTIKNLKASVERSGTVVKSRRSRQVV